MLEKEQNKILTIPNVLSTIRLILILPAAYYLWNGYNWTAAGIAFFGGLIDLADGYIARKFDMKSELGKILDPLADKLFVAMLIIILFIQSRIPDWFFYAVVIRDTLLLVGGLYASRKIKLVLPSNMPGKITALTVAFSLLFAIVDYILISSILIYISVFLMVWSLYLYSAIMIKNLKEVKL